MPKFCEETRTVNYQDVAIEYVLQRKKVKNINLRVRPDGSVVVSAGSRVPAARVDAFVAEKGGFILDAIARLQQAAEQNPPKQYIDGEVFYILGQPVVLQVEHGPAGVVRCGGFLRTTAPDPAKIPLIVQRYLDGECRRVFGEIMTSVQPLFRHWHYSVELPTLKIRTMKTRWGSCSPAQKAVTLNKKLLEYPESCIEYVVVHEFCHFVHPNHSRQFYQLLESIMPDWKARKVQLNNFRRD